MQDQAVMTRKDERDRGGNKWGGGGEEEVESEHGNGI